MRTQTHVRISRKKYLYRWWVFGEYTSAYNHARRHALPGLPLEVIETCVHISGRTPCDAKTHSSKLFTVPCSNATREKQRPAG